MRATTTQRGVRSLAAAAAAAAASRPSWPAATTRASRCRALEPRTHPALPGRRRIHVGAVLTPPLIFTGLFLALWTYKCVMLVLFQNLIIYNPFLPPNARSLTISDYARQCGGTQWREERIKSLDGTEIALCVGEVAPGPRPSRTHPPRARAYVLYFQGNASSLPPRLPDISGVLRQLRELDDSVHCTMVCVSYRGYWTSHDRPSEKGIDLDAEAALRWVSNLPDATTVEHHPPPAVVLWGQSIGCGFATNLAAKMAGDPPSSALAIGALVLETPFTNARAMLHALYPQKWLPYQHLWPFLRNHLDSLANIGTIARGSARGQGPAVYIVEAGGDELVPHDHGSILHRRCQELGLFAERHSIRGALHNDVMAKRGGKLALARSIASAIARASRAGS